ncbi:MAG: hypothetical protein ABJA71_01960 [Ginsengibacter sp.]
MLKKIKIFLLLLITICTSNIKAQDNLYTSYTTAANRTKLYRNLTTTSINKNLSIPLTEFTEEKWQEAFWALQLLQYKSPWIDDRIAKAFDSIEFKSDYFQKALMELAYASYPANFIAQTNYLLGKTTDPKIFALCAEYILRLDHDYTKCRQLEQLIKNKFDSTYQENPIINLLLMRLSEFLHSVPPLINNKSFTDILNKNFLPGEIIMYSFQRKNRDYPGLVIIRNKDGSFTRDSNGLVFNVSQLARSTTNLPFYLNGGNTPQGIFLMKGFNVSRSNFIGPTPNIQLSMPVEEKASVFLGDSSIIDTTWQMDYYNRLLPQSLKKYQPLYETYYAGLAGRSEIIAHGTTINPEYYKDQPWYPHTPSQGCLCTKEIWNGKRMESNQQKLIYALLSAGGAHGYCVVLDLDDKQTAVTIQEILPFLVKAESIK